MQKNILIGFAASIVLLLTAAIFCGSLNAQTEKIMAPAISQALCEPDTVPSDGQTLFKVTVRVTDPDSQADLTNVYLDLSAVGGGTTLQMYDDGTHGDLHPGDSIFTRNNLTVILGWPTGDFALTITAYDLQNDSTQESVWINVVEPNTAPVVGIVTVEPGTVPADGTTMYSVSADIFDANISTVTVNLYAIGGDSQTVMTNTTGNTYKVEELTIPLGTIPFTYSLRVKAVDQEGLTGTGTGSITVISPYTAPLISFITCAPAAVRADGTSEFVITAKVTDINGQANIQSVSLDLSTVNGSSSVAMYDDGTNGDTTAFDSVFSAGGLTVPGTVTPGTYTVSVTATDEQSLFHTSDLNIEVILANQPPNVYSVNFNPSSVKADGISVFTTSVTVDDMNGLSDIQSVTLDLSSIGGSGNLAMFDDGTHGDVSAGDGVYTVNALTVPLGTTPGTYLLEVTAVDAAFLTGSNTGELEVTDPLDIFSPQTKPAVFALHANYPNPFNPSTTVSFDLPAQSNVVLKIYNIMGQEVRSLLQKTLPAGRYHAVWNGKDNAGQSVASGMYIYRIQAVSQAGMKQTFTRTRKMLMMK